MPILLALIPFLTALVGLAERWIQRPKAGAEKKAIVVQAAETILEGVNAVTKTREIDTAEERALLTTAISEAIDAIVAAKNAAGVFRRSEPDVAPGDATASGGA